MIKKRLVLCGLIATGLIGLAGCGCGYKAVFDTVYKFDRAIISLPNGDVIEGEVETWQDYEDGEQLQIKIDGIVYLVHAENVTLIKE